MNETRITDVTLTRGLLRAVGSGPQPENVQVLHRDRALPDLKVSATAEGWGLDLFLPGELLSDGTETVTIVADGDVLHVLSITAGHAVARDVIQDLAMLRAELDLLKRAFRRHCSEETARPPKAPE